jgi:soluble lytic murein transglycosylase-like protein
MNQTVNLATSLATIHALKPALVCAVIEQESAWNPWAIRYEPAFFARYEVPLHLSETESRARAFSWGLMQVMGQVAREHGYTDDLAKLCDPETGIAVGCTVLAHKLATAQGDVSKALLLWNGGSNTAYPAQVLARVPRYQN